MWVCCCAHGDGTCVCVCVCAGVRVTAAICSQCHLAPNASGRLGVGGGGAVNEVCVYLLSVFAHAVGLSVCVSVCVCVCVAQGCPQK